MNFEARRSDLGRVCQMSSSGFTTFLGPVIRTESGDNATISSLPRR